MQFLPIFLNSKNRDCLVVGGGEVAARKIETLIRAGAEITVVCPDIGKSVAALVDEKVVKHLPRTFNDSDISQQLLIIAATNDHTVNARVSALASEHNIPVNVVDEPTLCTFIMPSIVDRSPVVVAVSTGGAAPVLARLLRAKLETMIPARYGELATLMQSARERVKEKLSGSLRRRFWESVVNGPVAERLLEGKTDAALAALNDMIDNADKVPTKGEVYLVGAGPGDPDLLTFRALRLMQQADVVVYDRLVAPELVALCRKDAERIYVGKERDRHALSQENINKLLIELAEAGKRVLRLKGGDPFMFGRGGEEIDQLTDAQIDFQIVPGITAASGCAAYAGIPLTHRDHAQQCIFVTGHMKDGRLNLPWQSLAQPQQTVVVYMGLYSLAEFSNQIIAAGLAKQTPIAIIERGTTTRQRVMTSVLATVAEDAIDLKFSSPALIIIGDVVRLRDRYQWYAHEQLSSP
ncbi:MAG: siroheme synthase CysG [Pseudomonadota bacterium]